MNKFATGSFFVCVFFWNKKYTFPYSFDLCGREGDKKVSTQPISGNKTTFFGGGALVNEKLYKRKISRATKKNSYPKLHDIYLSKQSSWGLCIVN